MGDAPGGNSGPEADRPDGDGPDTEVHAFLIADIRGYTSFTQEHGDEGAARLAARFAEVARATVADHHGRVIELRGDEALAVFGSPRSAIRAAVDLQRRFVEQTVSDPSLPLTVGIGLDAGEAVSVEGGYRGGALNVAGRLQARAHAGEVLASQEIVHLARRIEGVRFTDRGDLELKGLDHPVHVVAVRSEAADAAEAMAPFVRLTKPARAPHRRRNVVAGVIAFALLAALVTVPLTRRAEGSSEIEPNSVGVLNPESGEVMATIVLDDRPGSVASSEDAAWVTNPDVGTVTRIDPTDRQVRDTIQVGENPTGIAVGFDAVWVVESGGPSVSRISPDANEVVGESIEVGNGPAEIAIGEGSVWVTNRFDGTISRIDPDVGDVTETIAVGLDPRGIAIAFGSVWVGLGGSNSVARIDPVTGSVRKLIGVGSAPASLAVSEDAVWAANTLDDTVSKISPDSNSVVSTIVTGDGPSGITVLQGTVWVSNEADGSLSRIEPGQTSASQMPIGSIPQGLAGVNGDLWVSVRGTASSHRGGTLRLVSKGFGDESLDPAVAYGPYSWSLMHLLGDGLVAFEPIGGTNTRPVPDLALSIPTPTDGGRTYAFDLRPGVRYSNGEIVVPRDFRRALERGFALLPDVHMDLYGRLVGAEPCGNEPRTCDLSKGILTDDTNGTITFNLLTPDPDFLYKLALPFAYPVPRSTPDEEQLEAGVPGTGPYRLEAPMSRDGLALERNPHFRVWSPSAQPDGYVDRIQWAFGVGPAAQIAAVGVEETADLAFEWQTWDDLDGLFVRFPAQVHAAPAPSVFFVVLDTRSPPFDDIDVRRAVNLALDRERVVAIFGEAGVPTCQQLPPNFPGYEPYCPYTSNAGPEGEGSWTDPDLEQAKRLVRRSGTAEMSIRFEYISDWSLGPPLGEYLIELLKELGYRVTARPVAGEDFPTDGFQMAFYAWSSDYPAASGFFNPLHTCGAFIRPSSGFCDPEIDAMIDRATLTQIEDPVAAGDLWSEIDRAIVDQAPYLWLVNPNDVAFVSQRVENYQRHTQWGTLLNQLWVR